MPRKDSTAVAVTEEQTEVVPETLTEDEARSEILEVLAEGLNDLAEATAIIFGETIPTPEFVDEAIRRGIAEAEAGLATPVDIPEDVRAEVAAEMATEVDSVPAFIKAYEPWGSVLRPDLMPDETDPIALAYYGYPGKGKTTGLALLSQVGPVIFVDSERRFKKGAFQRAGGVLENIKVISDSSYGSLKSLAALMAARTEQGQPFAGFVWDAITEGASVITSKMVDDRVAAKLKVNKVENEFKVYLDEYGDLAEIIRRVFRLFANVTTLNGSKIHFGVSALAKEGKVEGANNRTTLNVTAGALKVVQGNTDVIMFVDHVRLPSGVTERFGLCDPAEPDLDAKDATGILPPRFTNPTFPRILEYSAGLITPDTDPDLAKLIAAIRAAEKKD